MPSRRLRGLRPGIGAWRKCASGRSTRIWRSACAANGSFRWIAGRRKSSTRTACARSSESSLSSSPIILALVGDAADGYPGVPGIGAVGAARLLNKYGAIEDFPPSVLREQRDLALLFKRLATLKTNAPLFRKVDRLRWRGPTGEFASWTERMKVPRMLERCLKLQRAQAETTRS